MSASHQFSLSNGFLRGPAGWVNWDLETKGHRLHVAGVWGSVARGRVGAVVSGGESVVGLVALLVAWRHHKGWRSWQAQA